MSFGFLKSIKVVLFIPQKGANAKNQGFFFLESQLLNIYQPTTVYLGPHFHHGCLRTPSLGVSCCGPGICCPDRLSASEGYIQGKLHPISLRYICAGGEYTLRTHWHPNPANSHKLPLTTAASARHSGSGVGGRTAEMNLASSFLLKLEEMNLFSWKWMGTSPR
jgi:hypothetical protein